MSEGDAMRLILQEQTRRPFSRSPEDMSDIAVYLGDGVWWQLSKRDVASRRFDHMPQRCRPTCPWRAA